MDEFVEASQHLDWMTKVCAAGAMLALLAGAVILARLYSVATGPVRGTSKTSGSLKVTLPQSLPTGHIREHWYLIPDEKTLEVARLYDLSQQGSKLAQVKLDRLVRRVIPGLQFLSFPHRLVVEFADLTPVVVVQEFPKYRELEEVSKLDPKKLTIRVARNGREIPVSMPGGLVLASTAHIIASYDDQPPHQPSPA